MSIKNRTVSMLAALMLTWNFMSLNVYGELENGVIPAGSQVKISPEGNWIREGGLNRYNGVTAEEKEDALRMEDQLKRDGYIKLRELTSEQFEAFVTNEETDWWFEYYIHDDDKYKEYYNDEYFRIYIYKPSFDDWWEGYKASGSAMSAGNIPTMEICNSSVVIDYRYWWSLERIGKDLSNELNDGIPSWYDTGYVEIDSPIDVEVRFKLINEGTFYNLYVTADTPFRCKMKYGNYKIEEINDVDLSNQKVNIPLNNNIQVGWGDNVNIETPVMLDITKTIEAYNIPAKDISGNPDRSLDQNQDLKEQRTVLQDPKKIIKKKKRTNIFRKIIVGLLAAALIGMLGVYLYFKRKRSYDP